jgi:hypothetical protein
MRKLNLICLLILGLALGLAASQTWMLQPSKADADTGPFKFNVMREHVQNLSRANRALGGPGHLEAIAYIKRQLNVPGITEFSQSTMALSASLANHYGANVNNLAFRVHGRTNGPALLLVTHYDSVSNSPGAADAASGVAVIIEVARALMNKGEPERDVIFLLTDSEEAGLLGMTAFMNDHPWRQDVGFALNLDARGIGGPVGIFEHVGNIDQRALVKFPYPNFNSLLSLLSQFIPNATDHLILRMHQIPSLNLAFGDGLYAYHSSMDTFEHLEATSLLHMASTVWHVVQEFQRQGTEAFICESPDQKVCAGNVFPAFGTRLISLENAYLQVMAVLLGLFGLWRWWRLHPVRWSQAAGALGLYLLVLAVMVGLAGAVDWILGYTVDLRTRFEVRPLYLAVLILWVSVGLSLVLTFPNAIRNLRLGAYLFLCLLLAPLLVLAPNSLYLPVSLLLPAALSLAKPSGKDGWNFAIVFSFVPALIIWINHFYIVAVLLQNAHVVPMVLLILLFMVILPSLFTTLEMTSSRRMTLILTLAATLFTAGLVGVGLSKGKLHRNSLSLVTGEDKQTYLIGDSDVDHDPWLAQELGRLDQKMPFDQVFFRSRRFYYRELPGTSLPVPDVSYRQITDHDGERAFHVTVKSGRKAPCLKIWNTSGRAFLKSLNGVTPTQIFRFSSKRDRDLVRMIYGEGALEPSIWLQFCGLKDDQSLDLVVTQEGREDIKLNVVDYAFDLAAFHQSRPRPVNFLPTQNSGLTYAQRSIVVSEKSHIEVKNHE